MSLMRRYKQIHPTEVCRLSLVNNNNKNRNNNNNTNNNANFLGGDRLVVMVMRIVMATAVAMAGLVQPV